MRVKAHVARAYKRCLTRELQLHDNADFESMLALSVHPKPYLSFVTFLEATWLSLRRRLPRKQQVAGAFHNRSCETVVALALVLFVLLALALVVALVLPLFVLLALALVVALTLSLFVLVKRHRSVP